MIAHVAAASELSGRVVLWFDPESKCTPEMLDAPVRLAAAYDAEIETIVVDQSADNGGGCKRMSNCLRRCHVWVYRAFLPASVTKGLLVREER